MAYYDEADWVDTLLPEKETRPEDTYYASTPGSTSGANYGDDAPETPNPGDPDQGGPTSPPPPAGTPPNVSPDVREPITGSVPVALVQALYPGYTIENGMFVWRGPDTPTVHDPKRAVEYISELAGFLNRSDYRGFFNRFIDTATTNPGSGMLTNPSVERVLGAAGITVFRNPNNPSKVHKIVLPNGSYVDVISGEGKWQWLDQGRPSSAGETSEGTGLKAGAGAPAFSYPYFEPPGFEAPPFDAPEAFDYPDFVPPDPVSFSDPGYEFARAEGLRARTNAASAEGLLRSGGFLKGLEQYAQGLGAQQYGNVYGRKQNEWLMGRGAAADEYDRNYQNLLTDWMRQYNAEADEFNRANLTYGTNFNTAATGAGINLNAGNARWNQLLSLYDLSSRSLPKYPAAAATPSGYGFSS